MEVLYHSDTYINIIMKLIGVKGTGNAVMEFWND